METSQLIENYKILIDQRLDELLLEDNNLLQKDIIEASRYSVFSGGKRLRPLFVLAVLHGFNIPLEKGLDPCCAIELIHAYSLIHDDLPSMDNDDYRRGRPTLHKVFPESIAILTGDFLLTYSFEILTKSLFISNEQKIQLIKTLSQRAGLYGMIGGQVSDIKSEGQSISWERLHFIHWHKTAALFTCCLEFGAIIAQVSLQDFKSLQNIGKALGVAFQIFNDLYGETADHSPPISDIVNQKATALTMLGKETAEQKAHLLLEEALKESASLSSPCIILQHLINSILKKHSLSHSKKY